MFRKLHFRNRGGRVRSKPVHGREQPRLGFEWLEERALLATFTVNSFLDKVDINPGNGFVDTGTAGEVTLRAAIMEANDLPGDDTINVPAGYFTLSIGGRNENGGAMGDLDVYSNVTITGAGALATFINGGQIDRVMHVAAGALTLSSVTITGGKAEHDTADVTRNYGGGIRNDAVLDVSDCRIISNNIYTTALAHGGGIASTANTMLTITNSTIEGNSANAYIGSERAYGGGVYAAGLVATIEGCDFSENSTVDYGGGGGLYLDGVPDSTITNCIFDNNSASSGGGGIDNSGTVIVTGSTISNNKSDNSTSGIRNSGSMTLTNTTVSGNKVEEWYGSGGGIGNSGSLTVSNSTITNNHAAPMFPAGPGGINNSGTANIKNTIVAGNTGAAGSPDVSGSFTSGGYNLIGDGSGSSGFGATGDQVGSAGSPIDPLLDPLQDNGGPTHTHALLSGSTAIDAGLNTGAPATDQRGEPRVLDGNLDGTATIDIGAFELFVTDVNDPPTDVSITSKEVAENQPAGTVVGILSTIDPDVGDTHTYSLVTGTGSVDNGSFTIAGNQLKTAAVFDYDTKSVYQIRVRSTDQGALWIEKHYAISVTKVNNAPTNIWLAGTNVAENQPAGTLVGFLGSTDPNAGDTFTYRLVAGAGSVDNAAFTIVGSQLRTAAPLDYEAKALHQIRLRSTDQGGRWTEKAFGIGVTDLNDAPTDLNLCCRTVTEHRPAGTWVGTLRTTDPDAGNTFSYQLVAGAGDADNGSFTIAVDELKTNASFDYATKSSYSVRVRSTDQGGMSAERALTITVAAEIGSDEVGFDAAFRAGATGTDEGYDVATDAAGNVYLAGQMDGPVNLDLGGGVALRDGDAFVAKYSPQGALLWANGFAGSFLDDFGRIAVDNAGNVLVTGSFSGTVDFDPASGGVANLASGSNNVFVLKLNSSGAYVWARQMGGTGYDVGRGIGTDSAGNVYVTGHFEGLGDFDPGAGTTAHMNATGRDIFICKLNAAGQYAWAVHMGGNDGINGGGDEGHALAVDPAGNVYATGIFFNTADFDPGAGTVSLTATGDYEDVFVVKLDTNGNLAWARRLGSGPTEVSTDVAVDSAGNVYTIGYFWGSSDFDPGPASYTLGSHGNSEDVFLSKLDAAGNFAWARSWGATGGDRGLGVGWDAGGHVYATGYFQSTVSLGSGLDDLVSAGAEDVFVTELDAASGSFMSAGRMGGSGYDVGRAIAVDTAGNVVATGAFTGTADVDPTAGSYPLTSAGQTDIFLMRMSAGGGAWDFGDAPDPIAGTPCCYGTRLSSNGARHGILPGFHLGERVDAESDGQPGLSALGDDQAGALSDEDGVVGQSSLVPGYEFWFDLRVAEPVGVDGYLDAWIDLNRDGIWDDEGEYFIQHVTIDDGVNHFQDVFPSEATPGTAYVRFRLSSQAQPLSPCGPAEDGEVEDYAVEIQADRADAIGVFRAGVWILDTSGNGKWDGGIDGVHTYGVATDAPLTGDFNGDGYDEIGVHHGNQFLLDYNGNGRWDTGVDRVYAFGLASDTPLIGDWNGDGRAEIGVRRGNQFILDYDGNGGWTAGVDRVYAFGQASDMPLTGDFNGDGHDEIAVRRGNQFLLDVNGNGLWDAGVDRVYYYGSASDTPLAGDWDQDGKDEIGVRRGNLFILDYDGNGGWTAGVDRVYTYGLSTDVPVIGAWQSYADDEIGVRRGNQFLLDVDGNGAWTAGDRVCAFGSASDVPITGDWNGDGYDEIGVRRGSQFLLDYDGSCTWTAADRVYAFGLASDVPVMGDWNGDGSDEIGVRRGNQFLLDYDGNGQWTVGVDRVFAFGLASDTPLRGDFDGDGRDEIGVRRGSQFLLDYDGSGTWTVGDRVYAFGLASDVPVAGDFNGDGYDEIGVRRGNQFLLDYDGNGQWTTGVDRVYAFGLAGDAPLIGNWAAAAPLMAAFGPTRIDSEVETLTEAAVAPLVAHGIEVYSSLPLSARQQALLGQVTVRVDDLAGAQLGEALGTTIRLDANAAGWGWFIDPTPRDNTEFDIPHSDLRTATSFDLLTVVMHELGHVLGYAHDDDGVMAETLAMGVRRLVDTRAIDDVFGSL